MSKITQITGRAVPVYGDDMDTDRIIPARYLKEITFSKMGDYPFYDERFNADGSKKDHPFNEERFQGSSILLANVNFGCGSSREHAPQSIMRWGIQAIVAESLAEIFAGNCTMLGIAAVTASKEDMKALQALTDKEPSTEFILDLGAMTIQGGALKVAIAMPAPKKSALVEGTWDSTGLLVGNADKVKAVVEKLPYMSDFS